jgi:hypothetical protein
VKPQSPLPTGRLPAALPAAYSAHGVCAGPCTGLRIKDIDTMDKWIL